MKRKAIIVLALGLLLLLVLGLYLTVMTDKVREEEAAVSPSPTATETSPEPTAMLEPSPFAAYREQMVRSQIEARGVKEPQVLEAMLTVPRHEFGKSVV